MKYCNVHYWNYIPGVDEEEILDAALSLTKKARHDSTLTEIATFIYNTTKAKYVIIGSLSEQHTHVQTVVFMEEGKLSGNFTYSLLGTPCQEVFTQKFCYYPIGVMDSFPEDEELKTLGIQSYLGSLLLSDNEEQIGLTVLMDTKQISNPAFAEHLIMVLGPAIEEELKSIKL